MPKPLLNAAVGVALALCSARALAGEGNAGTLGFIAGGGQGGDGAADKSNYYYAYLGAYYETPRLTGPLALRFSTLALDYSGLWLQSLPSAQAYQAQIFRVAAGPSFHVDLPGEWWLWDGLQAGMDVENSPGRWLPVLQNELMFGRGFFATYWKLDIRVNPGSGLEMRYLAGQIFFRLVPWLSFGPELRFQTSEPSVGVMAQVGENRPQQHWNVTAGCTFDEKLGGQWHLDLWFAF